jgi:hypothetical protein
VYRALKFLHIAGLVIFLGSIPAFIVVSALLDNASLENRAFGRKVIGAGTNVLTLPGLLLLAATGVWMGFMRYGPKERFFQLKLLLTAAIAANGYFFVVPNVRLATSLAAQSLEQGHLLPAYQGAYMQESVLGSLNLMFAVAAAVIGVWKIGVQTDRNKKMSAERPG